MTYDIIDRIKDRIISYQTDIISLYKHMEDFPKDRSDYTERIEQDKIIIAELKKMIKPEWDERDQILGYAE